VSPATLPPLADPVAAGLRDRRRPGWAAQVDPVALDMRCLPRAAYVLCQLAGPEELTSLVEELGGPITPPQTHPWAVAHGLEPENPDDPTHAALTIAWRGCLSPAACQGGAVTVSRCLTSAPTTWPAAGVPALGGAR
jgi:hypothetical protein